MTETLAYGYSSESFPMNTNMTGFRCFSKTVLYPFALDETSLSIERVNVKPCGAGGMLVPGV